MALSENNYGGREYRIGELAKLSGLPVSTLRYWERRGFLGGRRSEGGQRVFDDRDLAWALQARDLSQRRHMTEKLAETIAALVEASEQPVRITDPIPPRAMRGDANYEKMLDLAAQNARLFAEQRELAKDLAAAEQRFASLAERIAECLWTAEIDPNGTFRLKLCTPAITAITGYPVSFFLEHGDSFVQLSHPQDREHVVELFQQVLAGKSAALEYRIIRQDGQERWVRNAVNPSTDETTKLIRLDGMLSDITERKVADQALRESERNLRLIIENFPDVMYTQDRNLRYTSVLNPPRYPSEVVLGHTDFDLVPTEEAEFLSRIKRSVLESGETARVEYSGNVLGELRHYELTVSPLRSAAGDVEGLAAYGRDITARVDAADRLRQSERLYKSMLEKAQWGVCAVDINCQIVFLNDRFAGAMGWQTEPSRPLQISGFVAEGSREVLRKLAANSSGTRGSSVITLARVDGKLIEASATALYMPGIEKPAYVMLALSPANEQVSRGVVSVV